MNQIVLEDLDPIIIKRLKARAQKHGRSLQTEVKTILQQVTEAETKKSNFSEDEIIQRKSDLILQQIARHAQARSKPVHPSVTIPMRWSEEELVQVKARLKELKKGMSLGGLSIREAREEGRR
jgi:plasmid stability protein